MNHRLVPSTTSVGKSARGRLQAIDVSCAVGAAKFGCPVESAVGSDGNVGFRRVSVVSVKAVERSQHSGMRDAKDRTASAEAALIGAIDGRAIEIAAPIQRDAAIWRRPVLASGKVVQDAVSLRLCCRRCHQCHDKHERQNRGSQK